VLAPEFFGGIAADVPTGLEQRRRARQGTSGVHEVHRVGAPALGIPVEPRRVGGVLRQQSPGSSTEPVGRCW